MFPATALYALSVDYRAIRRQFPQLPAARAWVAAQILFWLPETTAADYNYVCRRLLVCSAAELLKMRQFVNFENRAQTLRDLQFTA